ncbi:RelB/StbD replicon stabilization protein (antitoxin to RelE/StbE) [Salmonella enterica subsp. enterica serovar Heidelberg str. 85-0486]|nr:RelB/StbD replicon stabilization protein (antitoxin to RelE/StbE) [Salmonella enterica subsp. enterica serovar Heidelberg str. 85-0486]
MPEMALQLPFLTVMNRLSTVCLRHFYAHLMDILEDEELGRIIDERANERVIEVNIDDL